MGSSVRVNSWFKLAEHTGLSLHIAWITEIDSMVKEGTVADIDRYNMYMKHTGPGCRSMEWLVCSDVKEFA